MTIDEAKALINRDAEVATFSLVSDNIRVVKHYKAVNIVTTILNELLPKINELERENVLKDAKIFAYEAILQNSNFKMAVVRKKEDK